MRSYEKPEFKKIQQPLHLEYSDFAQMYLEGGEAYKVADRLKSTKNHQIRKVLNEIKSALYEKDFNNAKKRVFMTVAMSAYNAGRMPQLNNIYAYLRNTINEQTIVSEKDIIALNDFFTSVVAYHKILSGKKDRR